MGGQFINRILIAIVLAAAAVGTSQAQPGRAASPAARPVPESIAEQTFPAELVERGRERFSSQCGFCHGLDTAGGSGGPDLTRSELVAGDVGGNQIGPVVREGRIDADVPMPAFPGISPAELDGLVAYIHDQKARAETLEGGRRAVSPEDVQSGNARAGQRYFDANCAGCHSPDGDLDGIASRYEGLALMQRMLNPGRGRPSPGAVPGVEVTTANGQTVSGSLEYRDEFMISLIEADGSYRSFSTSAVEFTIDDPLERHDELLGEFTNEQLHDVLTFLHTLR